jgi:hybrid cluster-associated redox disulfide protein
MASKITRATPIGELVMNHPVAAAVLLEHGFHCIGCSLSAYETLEQGAAVHGMDDAQIDALVKKLRDAAEREGEILRKATITPKYCGPEEKKPAEKTKKGKKPKPG